MLIFCTFNDVTTGTEVAYVTSNDGGEMNRDMSWPIETLYRH